jgi:pimeloyl-ACP methyl ester carboxylesterase
MSTDAATVTSGLARVNGVEIAYETRGAGRPLVVLHGGFGYAGEFGPNLDTWAANRTVIGVDLQSHGRTPAPVRPMRFETMADDIAALVRDLGHAQVDLLGYSLGGAVALRTAIQHPEIVRRLVVASTPWRRSGWMPTTIAGFDSMGPHIAEPFKQTPMYGVYRRIAPRVDDWPVLVDQLTSMLKLDYDWTAEASALPMPVMLVVGDADAMPLRYTAECFEALGGGVRDGSWDRSAMTRHALAVLPRTTHYEIATSPLLGAATAGFLDEA